MEGLVSCAPNPCPLHIRIVAPNGQGEFATIQEAINASAAGDTVLLMNGTFTGAGNRALDYAGKAITVISNGQNPDSCIIDCQGQARGFTFSSNEDSTSVLDAVTVTNGSAAAGGAITCTSSSPTIRNCIFTSNSAGLNGGALCLPHSSPTIDGCTFWRNSAASYGGAIYFDDSQAQLTGCTFVGNTASSSPLGGTIRLENSSPIDIQNSVIAFGGSGGAVSCEGGETPILLCCDIYGNVGGDWSDCIVGQLGSAGNISKHPLFCDADSGNFHLAVTSPCAPFSEPNPGCDLIGAWPVSCAEPEYACCVGATCQIETESDCNTAGGEWLPGMTGCDPNPCLEFACCADQSCQVVHQDECLAANGEWLEGVEICDPNPCLEYACCSGDTCNVLRQDSCATASGVWQEGIDSCDPNPCLEYACCVGETCSSLQPLECEDGGGQWHPLVTTCDPNPCLAFVCCVEDSCQITNQIACASAAGEWLPGVTSCDPNPCIAACCTGDVCELQTPSNCASSGSEWLVGVSSCDPNPCPEFACCMADTCQVLRQEPCTTSGGVWQDGCSSCDPNPCSQSACCLDDLCQLGTWLDCSNLSGEWLSSVPYCDPNPCLRRACCDGWSCAIVSEEDCILAGGEWQSETVSCTPNPCLPPSAADLSGGMLITHIPPDFYYTFGVDWCQRYVDEYAITSSDQQVNRIDVPEYQWVVWYVLAAWHQDKQWCGVEFGIGEYDQDLIGLDEFGPCHDGGIELPSAGWPGPNEGTRVLHQQSWIGNYVPVYWFTGYAYGYGNSGIIPLTVNATEPDSLAGFFNCDSVPIAFEAVCLGGLGINQDGIACHPSGISACCVADSCEVLLETECLAIGGIWQAEGTVCDPNPCVYNACCVDGACQLLKLGDCLVAGGVWLEGVTSCEPDPCLLLGGACCLPDYSCVVLPDSECTGAWIGGGVPCDPYPCAGLFNACCFPDGTCVATLEADCTELWMEGVPCDPNPCPILAAACCLSDDSCQITSHTQCVTIGGTSFPGWGSCDPNPCIPNACCVGTDCQLLNLETCISAGGELQVGFLSCDPNPCEDAACCIGADCHLYKQFECATAGGIWHQGVTACDPSPCIEAACCAEELCEVTDYWGCVALGGQWHDDTVSCDPNPCFTHVYVVHPDGTGDFATIQTAIDSAAPGDEIRLTNGVFSGPGNREINFNGKALTVKSQNVDPDSCTIDCQQYPGVYFVSDEGTGSVLEGVTITNGDWITGGAIHCYHSSPTLRNLVLTGNIANEYGGAIFCEHSANPTITNVLITGNSANMGGGIFLHTDSAPVLREVTIYGNNAPAGAGIYGDACSLPVTIEQTIVAFNTGGEAVSFSGQPLSLLCCDIYGNPGGDWTGEIAGQLGVNGNISEDPQFCDAGSDDFHLTNTSPCAPANNPACGRIGARPVGCGLEAPSNLTAQVVGPQAIALAWEDESTGELGFEIHRKTGAGGTWAVADSVAADIVSWGDSDLIEGTTYFYRLRAWNTTGYSGFSNHANAVAGTVPLAPNDLTATAVSPVGIDLAWVDQAINESGFHIQRRLAPAGEWQALVPSPGANANSFEDRDLIPSTEYEYRIRAYNQIGNSGWSDVAVDTTLDQIASFDADILVRFGVDPVADASVFVASGSGFEERGQTALDGRLLVAGLEIGDSIHVEKRFTGYLSVKPGHEAVDDLMWELWLNSDMMLEGGNYRSIRIEEEAGEYDIQLTHPVFRYNLVVSLFWNLAGDDPYWDLLADGLEHASSYLYNASDGQVMLGNVAVYDNAQKWNDADVRILLEEVPHAQVDGIFAPTASSGCISMGWKWQDQDPDHPIYYRTLVREFCHYALGLYSEDENGLGMQEWWQEYREAQPEIAPANYGLMDYQYTTTENSSANDYLANYPAEPSPWVVSNQLYRRDQSCWGYIADRLEGYYPGIEVVEPPFGWFPDNVSTDRLGPTDDVGLGGTLTLPDPMFFSTSPLTLNKHDATHSTGTATLCVRDEQPRVRGGHLFLNRGGQVRYLGQLGADAQIDVPGVQLGDRMMLYINDEHGARKLDEEVTPEAVANGELLMSRVGTLEPLGAISGRSDERAPGAAVDLTPSGSVTRPVIVVSVWPDEPLGSGPDVTYFCGSTTGALEMTPQSDGSYAGQYSVTVGDALFDGTGLFEISLEDSLANANTFIARFVLGETNPVEPTRLHIGTADLQVLSDEATSQITLAVSCNAPHYTPPGFTWTPTSDQYALHLSANDTYPDGGGLNIAYDGDGLMGIDETSLTVLRWDSSGLQWTSVDSSLVGSENDRISAPVHEGSVFLVFATATTLDVTAPAMVNDFGAIGGEGQGVVELDWTAPGDDGMDGFALEYEITYADSPITEGAWGGLPRLPGIGVPQRARTYETRTVTLPEAGHAYYLAIRAKDEAGNTSPVSNNAFVVSGTSDANYLPGPPSRFRAVDAPGDSGGVVDLSWQRSSDDGQGKESVELYRIYRNQPPGTSPVVLDSVLAGTTAYHDQSALVGQEYNYWVSAADTLQQVFAPENRALSARNLGVPIGDFNSDGAVAINDFSLFVDTFGIDSAAVEYDPLFDLDIDGEIYTGDFEILEVNFGEGGDPVVVPPGANVDIRVAPSFRPAGGLLWHLDVRVGQAIHLAGYSFRVIYPPELTFQSAAPDTGSASLCFLNRNGGLTPLFLIREDMPGQIWIANAIKRPTTDTAPSGDGFLARLIFSGFASGQVDVVDAMVLDHQKLMNWASSLSDLPRETRLLFPRLLSNSPNPFGDRTTIRFELPERMAVTLALYDICGRRVRLLLHEDLDRGAHGVLWDGLTPAGYPAASGVYFYQLDGGGHTTIRQLLLLR
ncbi:fibronectin type III domain-containing protein [Candidatus Eisenbacteria bacterium]|uniref:Probable pectate lyase C n=1 Tax=Eiseniibacteriota bacterium TaxID=2212470 RepID=A0ABV6YK49_UNCEI